MRNELKTFLIDRDTNGGAAAKVEMWNKEDNYLESISYHNLNEENPHEKADQYLHREDDKPAAIFYEEDGSVKKEMYLVKGIFHRENGPALVEYDNGIIVKEEFYIDGNHIRCTKIPNNAVNKKIYGEVAIISMEDYLLVPEEC